MVGPVNNTPPPPVATPLGGSGSSSSPTPMDTLSNLGYQTQNLSIYSADNPQIPKPTLLSVLQQVSLASEENKATAYENSTTIYLLSAKFNRDMIFTSDDILQLLYSVLTFQNQQQVFIELQLRAQIDAQNDVIANYNAGRVNDANQTATMHDAAETFNAAHALYLTQLDEGITPEQQETFDQAQLTYNTAVNNYNAYFNVRNPAIDSYNASITAYNIDILAMNTTILVINIFRSEHNLPLIASATPIPVPGYEAPYLPTAGTSPPSPVAVPNTLNPPFIPQVPPYDGVIDDLIAGVFLPESEITMTVLGNTQKGLKLIVSSQQFIDYILQTKINVKAIPPSDAPQMATSDTSTTGVGINAGLAAISVSLDPVVVTRLFNQGAQDANYQQIIAELDRDIVDTTLIATSNLLKNISLVTGQQLIELLQNSPQGDKTHDNIFAIGLAANILNIASRNVIANGLKESVGPNAANEAALKGLGSTMNLSLIGLATALLSSALGLPGLGAQLLGSAGVNNADIFNLTANGGTGFNNFAFNPFTQALFAEQLSARIAQNLGANNLQEGIQQALLQASLQTSPFAGSEQFFSNLAVALSNNAETKPLASQILNSASTAFFEPAFTSRVDFRNQLQQSLIDQDLDGNEALQIASSIAGVSPSAETDEPVNTKTVDIDFLSSNLAESLANLGIPSFQDITQNIINGLRENNQEIAEATFRNNIRHELEVQGLKQEVATRVASGLSIPSANLALLNQTNLHEQLVASFSDIYSPLLGEDRANAHAQQLADSILGPAVSALRDHLEEVKNLQNQAFFDTAMDNFKDYLKPTVDLYAFMEKAMDPAKRLVYANDIMMAPTATTGPVKMGGTNPPLEIAV